MTLRHMITYVGGKRFGRVEEQNGAQATFPRIVSPFLLLVEGGKKDELVNGERSRTENIRHVFHFDSCVDASLSS